MPAIARFTGAKAMQSSMHFTANVRHHTGCLHGADTPSAASATTAVFAWMFDRGTSVREWRLCHDGSVVNGDDRIDVRWKSVCDRPDM
jgi:hypothetical protein